jgi:hypothetical protein
MPILNASEVEARIRQSKRAIRSSKLVKNAQERWISEAWGRKCLTTLMALSDVLAHSP